MGEGGTVDNVGVATPLKQLDDRNRPVGGATTICLSTAEHEPAQESCDARPVGGASTICLGLEDADSDSNAQLPSGRSVGGATTICLGLEEEEIEQIVLAEPEANVRPVGGAATICLGLEDD